MSPDSTKTILRIGFGVSLGMMFSVALIALSVLHTSSKRIEQLVNANNTKANLIHQMRSAARERTVNLQNMLILDDPFRQDEEWMLLNANGAAFADARLRLLDMDLAPEEQALLSEQANLTRSVAALHLRIAELILAGDKRQASALLAEQAMPGQQETFERLSRLLTIQTEGAAQAVREAERNYRHTLIATLVLMLGITGLSVLIARFVTRRTTEAQDRLYAATEYAQVTLHSIGDGVITTDAAGRIEQINDEARRLTGWDVRTAAGRPVNAVFAPVRETDPETGIEPVAQVIDTRRVVTSDADVLLNHRSGRRFSIEYTAAPIFDRAHERLAGTVLVFRDVTQMRAIAQELAYQARHDMLTGLMNRREFENHVEAALSHVPARDGDPDWLCYLDLDQFKLINDTCGHLAGDEFLKMIARTLQAQIREADLLARMGGDEFAILLGRCTPEAATHIVERIRHAVVSTRFVWSDKSFSTSASIGLVPITAQTGTLYDLLSAADTACYVAKDEGRNRIHLLAEDDGAAERHTGEMRWARRIKQALEEDRFVLFHQRIAPLQTRSTDLHTEILVRMLDEDGSIISPAAFIPAAERYGLMAQIDRWVVRQTLDTLRRCLTSNTPGDCVVAMNLSAQSLCDDEFLPFVLAELDRCGFSAQHLCFEITETSAIGNLSRAIHFISSLRARGCRFALDDFGSGLSSFGYLKNLPVDFLKIDGSFVRDIETDAMDLALVDSINQIGHVAGIRTVAEYVETVEIQERLRRLGVDYAQGYAIARPVPLQELTDSLARPAGKRRDARRT